MEIITTEQLAMMYSIVDEYLLKVYEMNLMDIIDNKKITSSKVNYVLYLLNNKPKQSDHIIYFNEMYNKINAQFNEYNISDLCQMFYNSLDELSHKRIVRISDEILKMSSQSFVT